MAVFRIERTRDYTVMSNHHLRNANLSLKAKGLLSMMLSLPEDWNYTTRGLAKICKEGVDAIGAALRELEGAGYMPSILFAALTAWRLHIQAVQIAVSPLAHRVQNGDDALSKWGKRIYRLRRLFWNYFTMNHAVVFQIMKLLRKHLRRGVWNQPL